MEIKTEKTVKGTRILYGETAKLKSEIISVLRQLCLYMGFQEMYIPIMQEAETFKGKVGEENNNMMYTFTDRGNRNLCLAPEYTAVVQELSKTTFKYHKNVKIFYVVECFRGEKPQAGRYRQFTQFGVEVLNPSEDTKWLQELSLFAMTMIERVVPRTATISLSNDVTRGLDYYKEGKGFEISIPSLGAQKQVCGGGEYDGGIGFALGIDRLLVLHNIA